jgi:hypothetical protein
MARYVGNMKALISVTSPPQGYNRCIAVGLVHRLGLKTALNSRKVKKKVGRLNTELPVVQPEFWTVFKT